MSLKEKLKKIPGLRPAVKAVKHFFSDAGAISSFLAQGKLPKGEGPIRVGFVCQYIPVWHKLELVYEMMEKDPRFDPVIICVPSNIKDSRLVDDDGTNDTWQYFRENGYTQALNAMTADGGWLDLEQLKLDYVFFPRPYNNLMPACYHSRLVSRYTRICMVLYGMNISVEDADTTLNRDFFRYVHCFFAENTFSLKTNRSWSWLLHLLGLQHSVYFGMPGVESFYEAEALPRPAWDFSKGGFRALWTPRWTTDPAMGGSNFFTYYEFLFQFARDNPEYEFLFRPHPLTLSHFLETGEMTQAQVDDFLTQCETIPNISLDKEKGYAATFWGTDVLISDTSGLIPEFFVTGKPLIFCASNMYLKPVSSTLRMLEGCYVVYNKEELTACLEQLKQGIDPLAPIRQQIAQEMFGGSKRNPAAEIVAHLAKR